jgi:hypothetical protein
MNELHNPYAPPKTIVADTILENKNFQRVKILSNTGRMGRMRLFAYTFCSWYGMFIILSLFIFILSRFMTIPGAVKFVVDNISIFSLITLIPIFVFNFF